MMAMNKKELAEMEALKLRAEMAESAVFRYAFLNVEPDLKYQNIDSGKIIAGFVPAYDRVVYGYSRSVFHKNSEEPLINDSFRTSWSHDAQNLFSKKIDALQKLRQFVEIKCIKQLLIIDKQIKKEISDPTPQPQPFNM